MSSFKWTNDSPDSLVQKEDLKRVGFKKEDTLNTLMRKVDEYGLTKKDLMLYEMKAHESSIRERLPFIYGAIYDHYTWSNDEPY